MRERLTHILIEMDFDGEAFQEAMRAYHGDLESLEFELAFFRVHHHQE
jgi:hypothetical protein